MFCLSPKISCASKNFHINRLEVNQPTANDELPEENALFFTILKGIARLFRFINWKLTWIGSKACPLGDVLASS
jgi:hypothetical protein